MAGGMDDMRRTIRETEPARPSTSPEHDDRGDSTTTAKRRRIEPPKLITCSVATWTGSS